MAIRVAPLDDNLDFPEAVAQRQAERLRDSATPEGAALAEAFAPLADLRVPLDIWDAFDVKGVNDYDWLSETYEDYIDGVHAAIGSKATREQIGTSTIGKKPIYAYTAGPANAPHALIVGGSHGIEWGSIIATFRFFEGFVGDNPTMTGLRSRLRITYIPVLSPDVYRTGRNNANNVDPNRNYPFNWDYYDSTNEFYQKGAAPFSEGESQAAKTILDRYKIAMVMDCHQKQRGRNELEARGASTWIASNRKLVHIALAQWDQIYNTANRTFGEFAGSTGGQPVLTNWAAKYLRFDKKRYNAAAMTIEGDENLAGSVHRWSCTREAVRIYCGYIHLCLVEWLATGQSEALNVTSPITSAQIYGTPDAAPGTAIADGGQWIKTTDNTPVHWQSYPGSSLVKVPASKRLPYVDVAIPAPGTLFVQVTGLLEAAGTYDQLVEITPALQPWTPGNVTMEVAARLELFVPGLATLPDGTLDRSRKVPFTVTFSRHVPDIGDMNLFRAQVFARRRIGRDSPVLLSKCRMTVQFSQDDEIYPVPRVLPVSITTDTE